MEFHIKNSTGKAIQVRFYSQARVAIWPSATTGYDQNNKKSAAYSLNCNVGEKVCYAAWPKKQHDWSWGVGITGKNSCTACCYTCGANTGLINLTRPKS